MINKEIKQCVDRFVKALNPKTVYLFGSYLSTLEKTVTIEGVKVYESQ